MLKKYGSAKLDPSWEKRLCGTCSLMNHFVLVPLYFSHVTLDPTTLSTTKTFHILLNWRVLNICKFHVNLSTPGQEEECRRLLHKSADISLADTERK